MFCSPEIVKGHSSFNPFQADIYALGITFFYMITGEFPYPSFPIDELKRFIAFDQIDFSEYNVDPEIKYLIMKMTSNNPKMRPEASRLLKLPIFQQICISKRFTQSKHMNANVYPVLSQKNQVYRIASSSFAGIFFPNISIRKKNMNQKKQYENKCEIVQPKVLTSNS
ncbi:hypothetical protein M9Y10_025047 [Tritrichomonas musculus]|uniref:Protein kinase domain-containing protein n=1 Tax=Tritrichomonas musculus TaxID=1915356 RepID=A0ABR2HAD1_9EUKA